MWGCHSGDIQCGAMFGSTSGPTAIKLEQATFRGWMPYLVIFGKLLFHEFVGSTETGRVLVFTIASVHHRYKRKNINTTNLQSLQV